MIRKRNKFRLWFVLFLYSTALQLTAQNPNQGAVDQAREEQKKGNIHAAYTIMSRHITLKKNKVQPEIFWYTAQLAYLDNDFKASEGYYDIALKAMPNNIKLIEDYGAMLLTTGNYKKAIELLTPNLSSTKAKIYLAKTYYWMGDYVKANKVIRLFSDNERQFKSVQSFLHEYRLAKAVRLNAGYAYHTDDQPLVTKSQNISLSKKFNNAFEISVEANWNQHQFDSNQSKTKLLRCSNLFTMSGIHSSLRVVGGNYGLGSLSEWIYQLQWHTRVSKKFTVDLGLSREPYLYTNFSTRDMTVYKEQSAALNIENLEGLMGKIQYNHQLFNKNEINNFSGWLLYSVIKRKFITPRIGYAFQVSNADSTTFRAKNTEGPVGRNLAGVYYPYFTARNQQVHSALLQLQINASKNISCTIISSIPLYASIDNPYINVLLTGTGDTVYDNGFTPTRYYPFELKASTSVKVSDAMSLSATYQYSNLFFYTRNLFNLSTQILIK